MYRLFEFQSDMIKEMFIFNVHVPNIYCATFAIYNANYYRNGFYSSSWGSIGIFIGTELVILRGMQGQKYQPTGYGIHLKLRL